MLQTPWGGQLTIRPLAEAERQRAEVEAAEYLRVRGCAGDREVLGLEVTVRLLAASTGMEERSFRHGLMTGELYWLRLAWERLQLEAIPDMGKLKGALRRLYHQDPAVKADGALAYAAAHAGEFYGRPLIELTLGQLAYYSGVRELHEKFKPDSDGNRRMVTRQCLETQDG